MGTDSGQRHAVRKMISVLEEDGIERQYFFNASDMAQVFKVGVDYGRVEQVAQNSFMVEELSPGDWLTSVFKAGYRPVVKHPDLFEGEFELSVPPTACGAEAPRRHAGAPHRHAPAYALQGHSAQPAGEQQHGSWSLRPCSSTMESSKGYCPRDVQSPDSPRDVHRLVSDMELDFELSQFPSLEQLNVGAVVEGTHDAQLRHAQASDEIACSSRVQVQRDQSSSSKARPSDDVSNNLGKGKGQDDGGGDEDRKGEKSPDDEQDAIPKIEDVEAEYEFEVVVVFQGLKPGEGFHGKGMPEKPSGSVEEGHGKGVPEKPSGNVEESGIPQTSTHSLAIAIREEKEDEETTSQSSKSNWKFLRRLWGKHEPQAHHSVASGQQEEDVATGDLPPEQAHWLLRWWSRLTRRTAPPEAHGLVVACSEASKLFVTARLHFTFTTKKEWDHVEVKVNGSAGFETSGECCSASDDRLGVLHDGFLFAFSPTSGQVPVELMSCDIPEHDEADVVRKTTSSMTHSSSWNTGGRLQLRAEHRVSKRFKFTTLLPEIDTHNLRGSSSLQQGERSLSSNVYLLPGTTLAVHSKALGSSHQAIVEAESVEPKLSEVVGQPWSSLEFLPQKPGTSFVNGLSLGTSTRLPLVAVYKLLGDALHDYEVVLKRTVAESSSKKGEIVQGVQTYSQRVKVDHSRSWAHLNKKSLVLHPLHKQKELRIPVVRL